MLELGYRYIVNLVYWTMPSHWHSFCVGILVTAMVVGCGVFILNLKPKERL